MGLQVILHIQQVDPETVIDIPALNIHLMDNSGLDELYEEMKTDPRWKGPFTFDNGDLLIASNWDGEFPSHGSGYEKDSMVWGCWGEQTAQDFAKFVHSGKVVFHLEIEGNESEYFICTPSRMEKKVQSDLRF